MATKIVTKNSSTASAVPTASDLVQGELAVNVADKRLFTEDNAGAIVELGTNPTTLNVNGAATMDGLTVDVSSGGATITAASFKNNGGGANTKARLDFFAAATRYAGIAGGYGASAPQMSFDISGTDVLAINSTGIDVTGTIKSASATQSSLYLSNAARTNGFLIGRSLSSNDAQDLFIYDTTAASTRLSIDSVGRVGIGTSSPSALVDLGTSTGQKLLMYAASNIKYGMSIESSEYRMFSEDQAVLTFGHMARADGTTYTERMRIDSSGNVGIGNTVASSMNAGANQLVVGSGSTGQGITLYSSASTAGSIHFADGTSGSEAYRGQLVYNHNGDYMAMLTAATERMRIDSSGNLLVGTTSTIPFLLTSGTGAGITSGGTIMAGATAEAGLFNRVGSDGAIIQLYKAGGIVGSIKADAGSIGIGSGDCGLLFYDAGNRIIPRNNTSTSDASLDLGATTDRFKDLYLSGGVYLGGTGAANKLDDYEEGSWTPTIGASTDPTMTYNTQSAVYTKVGNLVSVTCKVITATRSGGSGQLTVDGLPFTVAANVDSPIYIGFNYNWTTPPNGGSCQQGTNHVLLYSSIENNIASVPVDILASGNSYLIFSATYRTNS